MDGVHQGAAEAGPGHGERVDGLHDSGVGGGVEGVEPVAHFVRDVDLSLATCHALSIPIAIPDRQVGGATKFERTLATAPLGPTSVPDRRPDGSGIQPNRRGPVRSIDARTQGPGPFVWSTRMDTLFEIDDCDRRVRDVGWSPLSGRFRSRWRTQHW